MKTITTVLTDTRSSRRPGIAVITDAAAPAMGQLRTPAELLAMDLLRQCNFKAQSVRYGDANAGLAGDLVAKGAGL